MTRRSALQQPAALAAQDRSGVESDPEAQHLRRAASRYLRQLAEAVVLKEIAAVHEKRFLPRKLLTPLTQEW